MKIFRGEIWQVNLNPTRGHEQAGMRPALIISIDFFHNGPAGLVVVIPITSKDKSIPLHVCIESKDSGLDRISFLKPEDIRSISKERLIKKLGQISEKQLDEVEDKVRIVLGL